MQIIPELRELNFDDNEIRVYIACLKLGGAKVNDIANASELIRTTTYGIIKSLIEKGVISKLLIDNIAYFQAVSPKELLNILEHKKEKISSIIPQLEKMQNLIPEKNKVEFFEGKNGIKTILNEVISTPNRTIKLVGSALNWMKFSKIYALIYYRKKEERNIVVKVINPNTQKEKQAMEKSIVKNSEFRYVKELKTTGSFLIFEDKIAFVNYDEDNVKGYIIQDIELVIIQNLLFDNLWENATP